MKLTTDAFAAQIKKTLPAVCLITGDEALLVAEAGDLLRAQARQQGFTEREVFFIERGFDWSRVRVAYRSLSLFADKRLLEVRLQGASLGKEGADVLAELAAHPVADTVLLVLADKLDAKAQATRWVKTIEQQGVVLSVSPIEIRQLPAWVSARLQRVGLRVTADAATLLAERVEGNLLAAQQEVDKLALLCPQGEIDSDTISAAVADSARYEVLQLGMAAMQGQAARALRILEGLRQEGVEVVLVLWAVNKDIQWLARVIFLVQQGQSVDAAMAAEYVWRPRQMAMKQAVRRLRSQALQGLLVDVAQVDAAIKGVNKRDPWMLLQAVVARLAGVRVARARLL